MTAMTAAAQPAATQPSRWYLVYTKSNRERIVFDNLQRQGYEAYLPRCETKVGKGQRQYTRKSALFPRYLFVRLEKHIDSWKPVRYTTGVVDLVKFGKRAACVSDDFIAALRGHEDESGLHILSERPLRQGDKVVFTNGPFIDYQAVFERKSGEERVVVLLHIADKCTSMTVPADSVQLAD